MLTFNDVFFAFIILGLLLIVGNAIHRSSHIWRSIFIPGSILAGVAGLLLEDRKCWERSFAAYWGEITGWPSAYFRSGCSTYGRAFPAFSSTSYLLLCFSVIRCPTSNKYGTPPNRKCFSAKR